MTNTNGPLRVGIGGPVGAGKTTLTAALCEALRDRVSMGAITNDIYTQEDAEALLRLQVRFRATGSSGSKPAAVRIRRSARTPRSTWRRWLTWCGVTPTSNCF